MDGRIDLDRIAALIRRVAPDVVTVQEVDSAVERTARIDQAAELGRATGMEHVFGAFMPYQGGGYGMALLSRFPVVEHWNHRLPDGAEPRTAVTARVRLPSGGTVVVSGIHFYRTEEERLAQANRLLDYLSGEQDPVILAGDFNSLPGSPVLHRLGETFSIPEKGKDRYTFPSRDPAREIDFIMIRSAARIEVLEYRPLDEPVASDHRPVLMVLVVRTAAKEDRWS